MPRREGAVRSPSRWKRSADLAGRTALRLSALKFLNRLAKILPPPRIHPHRCHGVFAPNAPLRPLVTARTQEDNALADPEPITQILAHIGEPTFPPLIHPARGPPQTELAMEAAGGEAEEVVQGSFPDDLDQSPAFDPTEPEFVPEDDFDQTSDA